VHRSYSDYYLVSYVLCNLWIRSTISLSPTAKLEYRTLLVNIWVATVLLVLEETSADSDYIQQLVLLAYPINSHVCDGMHRLQWLEQAMAAKGKTKYSTILKVTVDEGSRSVIRISMRNINTGIRQAIMWKRSPIGRLTFLREWLIKGVGQGALKHNASTQFLGCIKYVLRNIFLITQFRETTIRFFQVHKNLCISGFKCEISCHILYHLYVIKLASYCDYIQM